MSFQKPLNQAYSENELLALKEYFDKTSPHKEVIIPNQSNDDKDQEGDKNADPK